MKQISCKSMTCCKSTDADRETRTMLSSLEAVWCSRSPTSLSCKSACANTERAQRSGQQNFRRSFSESLAAGVNTEGLLKRRNSLASRFNEDARFSELRGDGFRAERCPLHHHHARSHTLTTMGRGPAAAPECQPAVAQSTRNTMTTVSAESLVSAPRSCAYRRQAGDVSQDTVFTGSLHEVATVVPCAGWRACLPGYLGLSKDLTASQTSRLCACQVCCVHAT